MTHPPSLSTSPWLQLFRWIMQPIELLEDCQHQFGDRFIVNLGNFRNFVFFSDPKAIEQIFTLTGQQMQVGQANKILKPTLGENSVLLLDGDRHQRQRQLLMPSFHGERMRAYGQLICHIAQHVADQWQINTPFAVRSSMQEVSMRVILQAVFGLNEGDRHEQIKTLLDRLLNLTASRVGFAIAIFQFLQKDLGAWSPGGRFNRLKAQIDDFLYSEIRTKRQNLDPTQTDILSLLLSARDENGQPMSDEELRDELMTLLIAGHETTATALSWAMYWIHRTPDVKTKLLAELDSLETLDPNSISRLPYLNAVCLETLRIYPVAVIAPARTLIAPVQILEDRFEPGMMLSPCIYLTHRREDLYPEADCFKPERFLQRQFSPYEYLPFGGGNRRCIGAAFALFEMKLVLATILKKYELKLVSDRPIAPIRRGVTIAPKGGVEMMLTGHRPIKALSFETEVQH